MMMMRLDLELDAGELSFIYTKCASLETVRPLFSRDAHSIESVIL